MNNTMNKMTLKTEGDRYIVVTRRFAAPMNLRHWRHSATVFGASIPMYCRVGTLSIST